MKEINNLDFYGKLKSMRYVCWDVKRRLESIVDKDAAWKFINELMDILESTITTYVADDEFNKEENFGDIYEAFSRHIGDVLEVVPLIKEGKVDYKPLLVILSLLISDIEEILPNNVKLARFLQRLLDCGEEISDEMGIDEATYLSVINKMLDNVDSLNEILKRDESKCLNYTK